MSSELERLLSPLTPADFIAGYWEKRALYIPGDAAKHADLAIDETGFSQAASRLPQMLRAHGFDKSGQLLDFTVGPEAIDPLYAAGITLCLSHMQRALPSFEAFGRGVSRALRHFGDVGINSYLSPDGAGFGLHFDDHSVFVLQLEGDKRWSYSRSPAVVGPPRNLVVLEGEVQAYRSEYPALPLPEPDETALVEQVLRPGDVLYLPAGTWHRASALGHSLALSMYLQTPSFVRLFARSLKPFLSTHEGWRGGSPSPAGKLSPDELPPEIEAHFERRLAELRTWLDSGAAKAALAKAWSTAVRAGAEQEDEDVEANAPSSSWGSLR